MKTQYYTAASLDGFIAQGDVVPVHAAMCAAAAGRHVWVVGGGDLAGQFHDAGLLDELIVQIGTGFAELRYAVMRGAAVPG